jgi:acyl-CoA synthetase (AMP-forming)/AMP-acid ligase II
VSGYRVSPTEVEEVVHASGLVDDAVVFGVPHPELGQAIVLLAVAAEGEPHGLLKACQRQLPAYMVPAHVALRREPFPRNPNGKIDRKALQADFATLFDDLESKP